MAQDDWHLTTEQLSAYLDKQLTPSEQAQLDAHLPDCARCQQELADLRRLVSLVHALPQPMLPRSFTLGPEIGAANIPEVATTSSDASKSDDHLPLRIVAPARQPLVEHRRPRAHLPGYVRTTLRTISTLAAAIGIIFFLSGVFSPYGGYSASSSAPMTTSGSSGSGSTANSAAAPTSETPHQATASSADITPTREMQPSLQRATAQAQIQATAQAQVQAQATEQAQTSATTPPDTYGPNTAMEPQPAPFIDLTTPGGRMIFGLILLVLGGVGFIVFKQRRQQGQS